MNKKVFSITICVVLILFSAKFLLAQIECGYSIYPLIETPHPYPTGGPRAPVVWSKKISEPGATWLRIHFSLFELNDEDYVDLIDKDGNLKERIKGIDVRSDETSRFKVLENPDRTVNFWAHTIDGDTIIVELHSVSKKSSGWGFIIDEIGVGTLPPEVVILSICGTGWLDQVCYEGTLKYTRACAVGRLKWKTGPNEWSYCTGFLVSCTGTNHFLTNQHCIDSQEDLNTLEVLFNYATLECGGSELPGIFVFADGDQLITSSAYYDFSLLTLKGNPVLAAGYLAPLDREPIQNESIYIAQHPHHLPKKIAEGVVNNVSAPFCGTPFAPITDFDYYVDTELGSSGSPVLSSSGRHHVIGLHHCGLCPNEAVKMSEIYPLIKNYIGCSEPPDAPSNLNATPDPPNQINLYWQDNSDNEIEFRIERTTSPPYFSEIALVDKNVNYYEDKTVVADITYYYRVRAYNPEGYSSYSNTASAKIPIGKPDAPSNLRARFRWSSQAVELTWRDNSDNEQGFAIERKSEWEPSFWEIDRVGANITYYEDSDVYGDTFYYYRVRAYNQAGYSPYSNVASVYVPWYSIYSVVRAENKY